MEVLIKENKGNYTDVTIDSDLNKYRHVVMNPKKLEKANSFIAKSGLVEHLKKEANLEQENAFWVSGTLSQADVRNSTFLITVQSERKVSKTNFIIFTLSETLNDLVKKNWGNTLTVFIKPLFNDKKRLKYELLEVKMS